MVWSAILGLFKQRPSVYITQPLPGQTLQSPVVVAGSATDNKNIARVELWVDGKLGQTQ